ncbi:SusD/RagB family nutrient-binding outer membrane lipoprotein [Pedobacter hiemivivus]|uniref:SusD/RagB family nutrient-binding outer membrane lipoprotein n=1 Tax=Pedobacter hiemivivus TaxID=2530454 RepID=A0A4U1GLH3_9SPHI|nr:SusD/RagB family nutrient-binding outer membrane lipoprotein [Pedobacter hiemivivus]TKC65247.1 SusD/RagB family nutrient-binding outer membrane lipoprotein [Pedobacter hiemivivus]
MNFYNKISAIALLSFTAFISCKDENLAEINIDPNRPGNVTTPTLILSAEKQIMDNVRNLDFSLNGTMLFAQYYSQNIYTDQSRYDLPKSTSDRYWADGFKALNNLNEIIKLNTNPATKAIAAAGTIAGTNANQIAICRVLKAFTFHSLSDAFGDIPYQSFGNADPSFEALQQNPDNYTPKYATQEKIYTDLLNELKQAADTLWKYSTANTFGASDIIYKGKNENWARFANSLRLRLATRIRTKLPTLSQQHFAEALAQGVFTSNIHTAAFKYSTSAPNEAPLYKATITANRQDFAVSHILINSLKGELGPFNTLDPRLPIYAKPNKNNEYVGQPYGLPLEAAGINKPADISLPGTLVNAADFSEVLQEYAEVAFLISEYQNWSDSEYKKGVVASLTRWGIAEPTAQTYANNLPAATKERVLTQKYFALYTQGLESWSEIRRTDFPNFLVKPNDVVWTRVTPTETFNYVFKPVFGNGIPKRIYYPIKEQSVNKNNYQQALAAQGDDVITTPIWWNK